MSGLNDGLLIPSLAAKFPAFRRWVELSLDQDVTEEQVIEFGKKNRIALFIETVNGILEGTISPEALEEFKEKKEQS
jgi:hypothetical protein